MSNKIKLQNNNINLQSILDTVNALPEEGLGDAFAVIGVTYPEGGICTCSNGTKIFELDDTSGQGFFLVDDIGEYTLTCVNGEDSETRVVTITEKGEVLNIELIVLPDEYQAVEYLESTGTQYIDTMFYPDSLDLFAEIDMAFVSLPSDGVICGMRNTVNDNDRRYFAGYYQNKWYMGSADLLQASASAEVNTRYLLQSRLKTGDNFLKVNGATLIQSTNMITSIFVQPMFLFAGNIGGTVGAYVAMKLYSAKLYSSSELKREFIPCYRKSDFVAGLYDRVSKAFFTNAGTGEFTLGPEVRTGVTWLYNKGYKAEGITGGWTGSGYTVSSARDKVNATVGTTLKCTVTNEYQQAIAGTNNAIDLTKINTLCVQVSEFYGTQGGLFVATSKNYNEMAVQTVITATGDYTLDVSQLSGNYYVGVFAVSAKVYSDVSYSKVWGT